MHKTRIIQGLKRKIKFLKAELYFARIYFKSLQNGDYLDNLAKIYKTDKWGDHSYTKHYTTHFEKFRLEKIKLLEIGVGGFVDPFSGGNSLRMWKRYFPLGQIYSIDIYDKSSHEEDRIKIFKGSQVDKEFLMNVVQETSELDFIIDDGSHMNEHVVATFKILFPLLKKGGIYVIEDTQTSYWPESGGSSENLDTSNTTMNFFKRLADGLNYKELMIPDYIPTYFDRSITSIHFYHNLIFVYKGDNNEESNLLKNNQKFK